MGDEKPDTRLTNVSASALIQRADRLWDDLKASHDKALNARRVRDETKGQERARKQAHIKFIEAFRERHAAIGTTFAFTGPVLGYLRAYVFSHPQDAAILKDFEQFVDSLDRPGLPGYQGPSMDMRTAERCLVKVKEVLTPLASQESSPPATGPKSLGQQLQEHIANTGDKQEHVAVVLGRHVSTVSRICRGKQQPRSALKHKIEEYLAPTPQRPK